MKLLITGCNGFVAGNLTGELLEKHEIVGVGRAAESAILGISYIQADISNRDLLIQKVKEQYRHIDVIIHAAAAGGGDVEELYQVNCLGTQNVADLALQLGCRKFIYISSMPVVGHPEQVPVTESHPADPLSVYHYTKYFGEWIAAQLVKKGVQMLVYRIPSPVGKGMPDGRIFSVFVKKSMRGEQIEIYGSGRRVQNYLDVRDFSRAVQRGLESCCSGVYNIIGNSISDYELAQCCVSYFHGEGNTISIKNADLCEDQWIISGEKARKELGYVPECSIEDSISYTVQGL